FLSIEKTSRMAGRHPPDLQELALEAQSPEHARNRGDLHHHEEHRGDLPVAGIGGGPARGGPTTHTPAAAPLFFSFPPPILLRSSAPRSLLVARQLSSSQVFASELFPNSVMLGLRQD